ncbi:MAG: hypothetical protein LBT16_08575, partial [Treponema sp.]|nr:hypothetical protein [Treponema sp.]
MPSPLGRKMWMLVLTFILFSCSTQAGQVPRENEFTFSLNIANNTDFDVSIIDGARIIPAKSEKKVTLPRYMDEIDNGYSLTWRVKLLDNIYMSIRQHENIIIRSGATSAAIDTADFFTGEAFIIVQNKSGGTIRLKRDNAYALRIEQLEGERKYSDAG